MKISEKLIHRLNTELNLNIPIHLRPKRLRQGWGSRSCGAWSWFVGGTIDFPMCYGSQCTMAEIVKAKRIETYSENEFDVSIIIS